MDRLIVMVGIGIVLAALVDVVLLLRENRRELKKVLYDLGEVNAKVLWVDAELEGARQQGEKQAETLSILAVRVNMIEEMLVAQRKQQVLMVNLISGLDGRVAMVEESTLYPVNPAVTDDPEAAAQDDGLPF